MLIFPVLIDTGIYQYTLKPTLQCMQYVVVTVNFETAYIFKEFYEAFVYKFFGFLQVIGVSVTDVHSKIGQEIIELLLAAAVIFYTTFQ